MALPNLMFWQEDLALLGGALASAC
jgi:hypothetical protein